MKIKVCLVYYRSLACSVYADLEHLCDYSLFASFHCLSASQIDRFFIARFEQLFFPDTIMFF